MKKLILEATDENILETIRNDKLHRTQDVRDFIKIIDNINYNAFISVDAAWGNGKTFFVRQIEMTLKYYNKKLYGKDISREEENAFGNNENLKELQLNNSYVPIYFNAWLYDNHVNALMALMLVAIKQSQMYVDTTLDYSMSDKICEVLDSVQFWKSGNWKALKDTYAGKNILDETVLLEETRNKIYEIFNDILVEQGQKLVVFVDELDRCKPTFAIDMLECIKHFFEDERIIFVVSLNKEQLIHTVKNYYGSGFDASGYLNRFFNINLQLPTCDMRIYMNMLQLQNYSSYLMTAISNEMRNAYKLSMRDTAIFLGKIQQIEAINRSYGNDVWTMLSVLVPIIHLLDVIAVDEKKKVIGGNGIDIIRKMVEKSESAKQAVSRFACGTYGPGEEFEAGWTEFCNIYNYAFVDDKNQGWYSLGLDIGKNFKNVCLRVCNESD